MDPKRRTLFLIWLMMAVAYLDRVNISVAGPAISASLRLSHAGFGLVLAAFTLGYALMQIPGGALADRFGARPLLVTALAVWSGFTALTGEAWSFVSLIAIRVLFGIGEGLENGAQFKLIGDYFSSRERSAANAFFLTALALGPALAVPAATALLAHVGWRGLFLWFALPGVAAALLLWFFLPPTPPQAAQREITGGPGRETGWREALRRPASWLAFAAYLFFNIAFWGFLGWMPSYLSDARHIRLAALGWTASVPYLCGFVGMLVMGRLGSGPLLYRRALLVGVCDLLAALFLYVAFTAESAIRSVTGLSLAAFFLYGGFGPFWAVALDLTPADMRGSFSGFVNFGGQIGGFCAPIIVGKIVDMTHSYTGGFLLMMAALVLAAGSLFWLQRTAEPPAPIMGSQNRNWPRASLPLTPPLLGAGGPASPALPRFPCVPAGYSSRGGSYDGARWKEKHMAMLTGKVAFVTGGASGIGRGTAKRFAQEGARVVLADVAEQQTEGAAAVSEIEAAGGQAFFVACDVSNADAVQSAIEQTISKYGKLDIVFANAGINGVWTPLEELQPEEWDRTIAINLRGTFLTLHFAVPHLKRGGGGSIIITSSVNGNRTFSSAGASAYSTSKAGQVALMKMAALELGRHNIRVNAVCPGAIETNIDERTEHRDTEKIGIKVELPEGSPAVHGGQGEPVDVADTCLFLASDLSRHVSGVDIYVDGGASLLR